MKKIFLNCHDMVLQSWLQVTITYSNFPFRQCVYSRVCITYSFLENILSTCNTDWWHYTTFLWLNVIRYLCPFPISTPLIFRRKKIKKKNYMKLRRKVANINFSNCALSKHNSNIAWTNPWENVYIHVWIKMCFKRPIGIISH